MCDHDAKQAVSRLRALERSRAICGNRFSPGQCFRIAFIEKMDEIGWGGLGYGVHACLTQATRKAGGYGYI